MNTLQAQKDQAHTMLLRHHECTQDLEYKQIQGMQKLRWSQQQYQHQTEWDNQMEYNKKAEMELQKKHLLELRQRPKALKVTWPNSDTTNMFFDISCNLCAYISCYRAVKIK